LGGLTHPQSERKPRKLGSRQKKKQTKRGGGGGEGKEGKKRGKSERNQNDPKGRGYENVKKKTTTKAQNTKKMGSVAIQGVGTNKGEKT